jgi:hypothetical protein
MMEAFYSRLLLRLVLYKVTDVSEERDSPFYALKRERIGFSETSLKEVRSRDSVGVVLDEMCVRTYGCPDVNGLLRSCEPIARAAEDCS